MSALLPLLAAGALFRFACTRADPERARRFGAFAPAAAFLIAFVALVGLPAVPFGERVLTAREGLFWVVVLAVPLCGRRRSAWLVVLTALLLFAVARASLRHQWTRGEAFGYLLGLGGAFVALAVMLQGLARKRAGAAVPVALTLATLGLSSCALLTSNALIGQLLGALASGLVAITTVGWKCRASFAGGALTMTLVIQCGLAYSLAFYGGVPRSDVAILVASPLAAWLVEPFALTSRKRELTRALVVALPVALVTLRRLLAFLGDPYLG